MSVPYFFCGGLCLLQRSVAALFPGQVELCLFFADVGGSGFNLDSSAFFELQVCAGPFSFALCISRLSGACGIFPGAVSGEGRVKYDDEKTFPSFLKSPAIIY